MSNGLDHLLIGASSLTKGNSYAEALFHRRPAMGGEHPDYGTCNSILGLVDNTYIEVIAPRESQSVLSKPTQKLLQFPEPALFTWCWRFDDIELAERELRVAGVKTSNVIPATRVFPDGHSIHWRFLFIEESDLGDMAPFLIDWQDTSHPSCNTPPAGRVHSVRISHPHASKLRDIFDVLQIGNPCQVIEREHAELAVEVAIEHGRTVTLQSNPALGSVFR